MSRRILAPVFLLAALAASAGAQTDTWLEVHTPNFVVVSNSSEKQSLRAALQFERMRSVFHRVFPNANLDTATPILVLAVADKRNLQALEPSVYLGKGQMSLAGLFVQMPERDYVLVWLNAPGLHPYSAVYHEYAHFVLHRTGERIPLWLDEGFAEFYQNTEIRDDETRLGQVDAYYPEFLQRNQLLPLATLFAVDQHSPYYHEQDKGSIFYAESWALAHYLKLKDSREGTHRLADYLDLVHKNIDTVAAAAQAFGDLDQLQADLKKYVVNGDYRYLQLPGSTDVDESSFAVRTMTQTQADIARADFLAHDGRDTEARALLEAVLHDDPANVPAHEIMGFIGIRQHNLGEARQWCEQAIKLDPKSFLGQSCFALSSVEKGLPDAAGQAGIENSLRAAIKINPSFTPAYAGLAEFFAHRRQNDEALQWIQKAIQLDRDTVDFRIDEAGILLQMNRNQDGIEALDLALKMAHTPEETAAVENMLQSAKQFEVEHVVVGKAIRSGARQTESEADLPGARCAIQCQRNPRRRCSRDSSSRYLLAATRVHRRGPSIQARRNLRRLAHGWYRWQAEQCCRDQETRHGARRKSCRGTAKVEI